MAVTPNLEDLDAQLKKLQAQIDEIRNVSPTSLTVKDRNTGTNIVETGYDAAHSNRSFFKLRDSLGNVIVANDTAVGWGMSLPVMPYVMYPFQFFNDTYPGGTLSSASAMSNASNGDVIYWNSGQVINSPVLKYGFDLQLFGGCTSATFRLTYTNHLNVLVDIFNVTLTSSNNNYQGSYVFPTGEFGAGNNMSAWCKNNSGTGRCATTPYYVLGYGG